MKWAGNQEPLAQSQALRSQGRGDAGGRGELSHLCCGGMQDRGGAGWAESILSWLNFICVLSDAGCNSFLFLSMLF